METTAKHVNLFKKQFKKQVNIKMNTGTEKKLQGHHKEKSFFLKNQEFGV